MENDDRIILVNKAEEKDYGYFDWTCCSYIESSYYDLKKVKKIYLNADGGIWIQSEKKRIEEITAYILSNWTAEKIRLKDRNTVKGCSAEGYVSHVLSSRMSSRPMGWSWTGVDKMAHLKAYYWNGGDMLKLVRQRHNKLGKYREHKPQCQCRSEKVCMV